MNRPSRPTRPPRERVLVCGARGFEDDVGVDEDLSEARGLVAAAAAEVVGEGVLQRKPTPDAATLLGRGKVDEIRAEVQRLAPDAVVVDNDLTPAQVRNLEKAWGVRVVDRSELILDIFARRAQTRQAKLQENDARDRILLRQGVPAQRDLADQQRSNGEHDHEQHQRRRQRASGSGAHGSKLRVSTVWPACWRAATRASSASIIAGPAQ